MHSGFLVTGPINISQGSWNLGLSELKWAMQLSINLLFIRASRGITPGMTNSPPGIIICLKYFLPHRKNTEAKTIKYLTYTGPSGTGFINLFISFPCLRRK